MDNVAILCIVALVCFLLPLGRRYGQLIWWSIKIVGVKNTVSDLRGLTKTYMAIGSVLHGSNLFFSEFELDLYHAGLGISCKKGDGMQYIIHSKQRLPPSDMIMLYDISQKMRGDCKWVENADDGRGDVLLMENGDVLKFATVPVTLAYYHLTKNAIRHDVKSRAEYGNARPVHSGTLCNNNDTHFNLGVSDLPHLCQQ